MKLGPVGMAKRRRWAGRRCRIGLLCALVLIATGCGRKAPPRPPRAEPLPVATGLTAKLAGDQVLLAWTLAPLAGRMAQEARFALYRDALPAGAGACPNCPPQYELVAQLPYDPNAPRVNRDLVFKFVDSVAVGYRYRYQVALRLSNGRQGDPSETVEVTLD